MYCLNIFTFICLSNYIANDFFQYIFWFIFRFDSIPERHHWQHSIVHSNVVIVGILVFLFGVVIYLGCILSFCLVSCKGSPNLRHRHHQDHHRFWWLQSILTANFRPILFRIAALLFYITTLIQTHVHIMGVEYNEFNWIHQLSKHNTRVRVWIVWLFLHNNTISTHYILGKWRVPYNQCTCIG